MLHNFSPSLCDLEDAVRVQICMAAEPYHPSELRNRAISLFVAAVGAASFPTRPLAPCPTWRPLALLPFQNGRWRRCWGVLRPLTPLAAPLAPLAAVGAAEQKLEPKWRRMMSMIMMMMLLLLLL